MLSMFCPLEMIWLMDKTGLMTILPLFCSLSNNLWLWTLSRQERGKPVKGTQVARIKRALGEPAQQSVNVHRHLFYG